MTSKKHLIGWLCITILAVGLSNSCTSRKPIYVGFAGELTGKYSDLGVHGRNGAQLAVDEINEAGGVGGRYIELLVRDDMGTPEGAQDVDNKLIDAGVVAIIGHMTSGQTLAALPVTEKAGMVLLSPTTSTPDLSGLDDRFFRVNPDNALEARTLAHQVYEQHNLTHLAVIYDSSNAAYTQTFWTAFAQAYRALGGQVAGKTSFSSSEETDFALLTAELQPTEAEALLIIASALDTALIAQQTRINDWQTTLFASGWAQTEALIQNGGQAVEGIKIVMNYDANSLKPAFLDFQTRYLERFGRPPTFAAAQAYEAVIVLTAALEKTNGQAEGLCESLLETENLQGLTGNISVDEYGDVIRTQFLITVQNGQFVTLSTIEPAQHLELGD